MRKITHSREIPFKKEEQRVWFPRVLPDTFAAIRNWSLVAVRTKDTTPHSKQTHRRKTAIYGIMLASIAALLTAFTSDFCQFVILRFFVSLGMALFFGPGVTLIAKYFRHESEGFAVGIFNGAFYIEGSLGLFE